MKTFKKVFPILVLTAFFIPFFVFAGQTIEIPNPLGQTSTIWDVVGKIINFLFTISIIAGVFVIIYAGYMFLFSAGDPEKVKTARHIIIYTVIGIIVIFLSKPIINLFLKVLGSKAQIK